MLYTINIYFFKKHQKMQDSKAKTIKNVLCAGLATSTEYFDFTLFGLCVIYISATFFPDTMPRYEQILSTFGLFAAGYVMRPLGGMFFGNLGDKIGRKKVLIYTVGLMMLSMSIIVFTPGYKTLGIYSILLILVARFIQGFSIGGEYNGVIAMLSEQATSKNRGRITSFGTFLEGNGCLFAVVVMLVMTSILSSEEMYAYGWRIAYAIGLGFSIVAFIAQFIQDESKEFLKIKNNNEIIDMPLKVVFQSHKYSVFVVFCLAGYLGIAYYMFMGFMPTFMEEKLNFNYHHVMIVTAIASAAYAWVAPFWGMLSDKVGRKPLLIGNSIGLGLLVYPVFLSLATQNLTLITLLLSVMMIMIAGATSTFVTTINELFPTNVRFSGVATGYNISNAIFGGTTPLIAGIAITLFGTYAASYYLIFATVCIVLVIWKMPETKGVEF